MSTDRISGQRAEGQLDLHHKRLSDVRLLPTAADRFKGTYWISDETQFGRNGQGEVAGFSGGNGGVRHDPHQSQRRNQQHKTIKQVIASKTAPTAIVDDRSAAGQLSKAALSWGVEVDVYIYLDIGMGGQTRPSMHRRRSCMTIAMRCLGCGGLARLRRLGARARS